MRNRRKRTAWSKKLLKIFWNWRMWCLDSLQEMLDEAVQDSPDLEKIILLARSYRSFYRYLWKTYQLSPCAILYYHSNIAKLSSNLSKATRQIWFQAVRNKRSIKLVTMIKSRLMNICALSKAQKWSSRYFLSDHMGSAVLKHREAKILRSSVSAAYDHSNQCRPYRSHNPEGAPNRKPACEVCLL